MGERYISLDEAGRLDAEIRRLNDELATLRGRIADVEHQKKIVGKVGDELARRLRAANARAESAEAARAVLASRVRNQRRELRRLNVTQRRIAAYWLGYENGLRREGECRLRGIMHKAFGSERVRAAEMEAASEAAKALDGGTRVVITGWKLRSNNVLPIHVWHERPSDPDELYEPCDVVVCDGQEGKV